MTITTANAQNRIRPMDVCKNISLFCPWPSCVSVHLSSLSILCCLCMCNAVSDSLILCMLNPFPVIMLYIYFRFLLILLVTIDMISHQWVKRLLRIGYSFNKKWSSDLAFGWASIILILNFSVCTALPQYCQPITEELHEPHWSITGFKICCERTN